MNQNKEIELLVKLKYKITVYKTWVEFYSWYPSEVVTKVRSRYASIAGYSSATIRKLLLEELCKYEENIINASV